jgi:D-galactarolactone cycloisomerase
MKITRVEPILVSIPDRNEPKPAYGPGARGMADILFIRVDTDAGVTGWGEAFSFVGGAVTVLAMKALVAPLAIGRDPADISTLMTELLRRLQHVSRNGPVASALSGLDIALWDIAGKVAGKPISALLGGAKRSRLAAYATLMRFEEPTIVMRAVNAALERGYKQIKLHEHTVPAVAVARDAVGPEITLMLDTNCSWTTVDEVLGIARQFAPYNLAWLEEPLFPPDEFDGLAEIRKASPIPIAAGENLGNYNDVRRMVDAGAVDIVQPSIAKMGGVSEIWKAIAYAESRGVKAIPHAPYTGPALIASLHVMAAMQSEVPCEHRNCDLEAKPLGDWCSARDGYICVPDGAGLGVEPEMKVIERYRVQ